MLCLLLVTLALLACALAESNLRQAVSAPAALPKGHQSFLRDFQRRSKLAANIDIDDEEVDVVNAAAANPNPNPMSTRFTGFAYQLQTNSPDCANPDRPYQEASFKLGVCHPHYKARKSQPKSSMFYLQYDNHGFTIFAQYYSDAKCSPESFLSDGPFMNGMTCDHGAQARWASNPSPALSGLITTWSFGSECPMGPLDPKYTVFTNTTTPLGICQDEEEGGSHLMTDCNVNAGNIFVNGLSYDAPGCTGASNPIVDVNFGPTCDKAGRKAFQITSCVKPAAP